MSETARMPSAIGFPTNSVFIGDQLTVYSSWKVRETANKTAGDVIDYVESDSKNYRGGIRTFMRINRVA